jgi:hypothetical protein
VISSYLDNTFNGAKLHTVYEAGFLGIPFASLFGFSGICTIMTLSSKEMVGIL